MEEETEYEQSQLMWSRPGDWPIAYSDEKMSAWDDFCASVTDGCDDE